MSSSTETASDATPTRAEITLPARRSREVGLPMVISIAIAALGIGFALGAVLTGG